MTLDEGRFAKLADETLERIGDAVDDALGDEIDVELQAGILTMALPGGGQYVINKHAPNREIWMSSPASGATHFGYADGKWVSTRDAAKVLEEMLAAELKARFGVEVEF
ncbi:MAG TPA: iron donor protein CyaY [Magnetospirillum sp.]|jgi:frataxin|nr:iron donor protein CyaY [Magnetospirillum sp.]